MNAFYDQLRAKRLIVKLSRSRRYQLLSQVYSICLVFLKLFERIYAPLTAGLLNPISGDARLQAKHRSQLDCPRPRPQSRVKPTQTRTKFPFFPL
jgi:hypothetical protein